MSTAYLARSKLFEAKNFRTRVAASEDPTSVYRDTLRAGFETLETFYQRGAAAQDLVSGRSWLVDQVLAEAWSEHFTPELAARSCLAAAGGYGRAELHPCSDIDLLLLLKSSPSDAMRDAIERFMRFLWDIGLEVGHSVRTVKECVTQAKSDITIITNLTESRYLLGDASLFEKMKQQTAPGKIWSPKKFFDAKMTEQNERHLRYEETGYNLEPNLKDGPGGLRDIHMINWVASRYYEVASLKELIEHGFLTEEEHRTLIRGRNFLWRLRAGLHFMAGRTEDRLLFDHQRRLAAEFGYEDRKDSLAVEQLMKRYYRTVKDISLLNELLLQHFAEAIFARSKPRKDRINRRFESINGYLDTANSRVFERYPFAMLEIFHILQQDSSLKGVRAKAIRELRANLHRIDQDFRNDVRSRSLFLAIMREPSGQTHALRRMNAYGVLGSYIPAFGHIVGQMQHDLFHVYTVDAHSLFVVRNTRRMALDKHAEDHPLANEIMARLFKRERLYLAALFHDIAKGRGGDHSELGEKDAYQFCKHHDMSEYDASLVGWLVRFHLKMSWTAQREDISDPAVVADFAAAVGDQEHLDHLYLLTIADMRGTNPAVWNNWKARLLEDLYRLTSRHLRLGLGVAEEIESRVEDRKRDARKALETTATDMNIVERLWDIHEKDYFTRHDADTISWHAREITAASALDLPLVRARFAPDTRTTQCLIFAPNAEDLLLRVTAGFDRVNIDIVDARCHQARAGFALYAFVVMAPGGKTIESDADIENMCRRVLDHLHAEKATRNPPKPPSSRTVKAFPTQTRVTFADRLAPESGDAAEEADTAAQESTTMEVIAQDRPGLLHQVSLALMDCKVVLRSARIATYGERAEDVFFICDRDGNPVTNEAQRECLSSRIHSALETPEALKTA